MFNPAAPLESLRLDGDVALVTGGGGGIGREVARALAAAGAAVAVADVDEAAAAGVVEVVRRAGGAGAAVALDIADEDSVERALERTGAALGPVSALVNNAGIAIREPSTALALADWQKVVDVNMTGVFLCARAVVRRFEAAAGRPGPAPRPPRVVNMASIMGLSGGGLYTNPSYQATKGAVVNMTRAMAVEWAPLGVRVNAVAPHLGAHRLHRRPRVPPRADGAHRGGDPARPSRGARRRRCCSCSPRRRL